MFVFDVVYVVLGAFFVWMFYDVVSGVRRDWNNLNTRSEKERIIQNG